MEMSGFSHIGLATHDMEATIAFYCGVLEFSIVAEQWAEVTGGGEIRMTYIGCGAGSYVVFMQSQGVLEIPDDFDTGINGPLGLPSGMYHFAFAEASLEGLERRREKLLAAGVEVSAVIDHDYARSIYFADPNGVQLEFCWQSRPFEARDIGERAGVTIA